jgi:hypothetical protein
VYLAVLEKTIGTSLKNLPSMVAATAQYESWAARQLAVTPSDVAPKHRHMAEAVFPFMRATFYRWAQL